MYLYFDGKNGQSLAIMDAGTITKLRTAATSALASSYLSDNNFTRMLMIGTGTQAPEMIKAHCSVKNIKEVMIWGRDYSKAKRMAAEIKVPEDNVTAIKSLEEGSDYICCNFITGAID